jgi:hypothetical protein
MACFLCEDVFDCVVRKHEHRPGFITYLGSNDDEVYAWETGTDRVACSRCLKMLGYDPRTWDCVAIQTWCVTPDVQSSM